MKSLYGPLSVLGIGIQWKNKPVPYLHVLSSLVHLRQVNKLINKLVHNIRCPTFSQQRNSFLPLILQNVQQDSPLNPRMQTYIYAVLASF